MSHVFINLVKLITPARMYGRDIICYVKSVHHVIRWCIRHQRAIFVCFPALLPRFFLRVLNLHHAEFRPHSRCSMQIFSIFGSLRNLEVSNFHVAVKLTTVSDPWVIVSAQNRELLTRKQHRYRILCRTCDCLGSFGIGQGHQGQAQGHLGQVQNHLLRIRAVRARFEALETVLRLIFVVMATMDAVGCQMCWKTCQIYDALTVLSLFWKGGLQIGPRGTVDTLNLKQLSVHVMHGFYIADYEHLRDAFMARLGVGFLEFNCIG